MRSSSKPASSDLPHELWGLVVACSPEVTIITDRDLLCHFASDSVTEMTGYPLGQLIGSDLSEILHEDDGTRIEEALVALTGGATQVELDARALFMDGAWHDLNIRARGVHHGDSEWLVVTVRDVTSDRRNEAALFRKVELERTLELVQRRFIHIAPDDIDLTLTWALREIAMFLGADRGYLLGYDLEAGTESMTNEWCRPDVEPDLPRYQNIELSRTPILTDRCLAGETIAVLDIAALDGTWSVDRDHLLEEGLISLLEFPIILGGETVGSVGFDWTRDVATWTNDDLTGLGMFASTFAQVLARKDSAIRMAQTVDELRMGFEGSPVPLALVDLGGVLRRVSEELSHLVGFSPDELIGRSVLDVVVDDDRARTETWGLNVIASDGHDRTVLEAELRTCHDRRIWAQLTARPIRNQRGEAANYVVKYEDITLQREAEAALDASENRFANLVNNLPDPVMRVDPDGEILFTNQAAQLVRSDIEETGADVPTRYSDLIRRTRVRAFETGETQTASYEIETSAGQRYLETRFVPEPGPDGQIRSLLLVSSDLTDRRRGEAELAYRATHDSLTDLPNRPAFLAHLQGALARFRPSAHELVAVLFFDLDRFKVVNDSLGHGAGDELLVAIGHRLRDAMRPGDVIARLGGDEFTVLIAGATDAAQVLFAAERLQGSLATPIEVAGRPLVVSCSIGVALASTGTERPAELMQRADAAMYQAKERGRNRIAVFDDALAAAVNERLDLDQRLRQALEAGQFVVHYQPEVELRTGRVLGAEALLRWDDGHDLVSAAEFIDLVEETGLIVPIGTWVLNEACRQAAAWMNRWPERELLVRVNLSARQLDEPDLVAKVSAALAGASLPASRLCLEITETALMANAEASRELLIALADLGVTLAVDDFGTGYSSLSYLKLFPVSVLKIDRSFVDGIPGDAEDTAIVTTIVRLAESLGMDVTAEGIETEEQAETLTKLGCERGQGFHYARPMAADRFASYVDDDAYPTGDRRGD